MISSFWNLFNRRWLPRKPRQASRGDSDVFYASNIEYHDMTGGGDKTLHPQVRLLMTLVREGGNYLEVGCGSGRVCHHVGTVARVMGVDVSPIAIQRAAKDSRSVNEEFRQAEAENLPFEKEMFDGVFSFEFLEHSWSAKSALVEMVRVLKPGGFLLLSAPNGFSLDLHLDKRWYVRVVEYLLAMVRLLLNKCTGAVYLPVEPRLDGAIYPDCDMVAALIPSNMASFLAKHGMDVDFWDTTYMCAQKEGATTDLKFQRLCAHPFFKHFGDHILMLARKRA